MSLDIIRDAYFANPLQVASPETPEVSELWVKVIWELLKDADHRLLAHMARHPDQFHRAVAPLFKGL